MAKVASFTTGPSMLPQTELRSLFFAFHDPCAGSIEAGPGGEYAIPLAIPLKDIAAAVQDGTGSRENDTDFRLTTHNSVEAFFDPWRRHTGGMETRGDA